MPSFNKLSLFAAVATALLPAVHAHGQVKGVLADGVYTSGPNIYYAADSKNAGTAVRVQYQASGTAFNVPSQWSDNSAMSCEGASGAPVSVDITAGSVLRIYWAGATNDLLGKAGVGDTGGTDSTNYPWVHAMGPIADYIASCNGDCSSFDASTAGWSLLDKMGIDYSQTISDGLRTTMTNKPEKYYPTSGSGLWAMAKLVQQGSWWETTIPAELEAGQYIVRNEMTAVHNPLSSGGDRPGPQMYIACVQVNVKDGGSQTLPAGTQAGSLYSPSGDFANFNVYAGDEWKDPFPDVLSFASSSSSFSSGSSSSSSSSSSSATSEASSSEAPAQTATSSSDATNNAPSTTLTSTASAETTSGSSNSTGACRERRSIKKRMESHKNMKRQPFPHTH
ncbi:glycoside hydrolase family 61 protein [Desarmillaria tabescens]|uniref:Glycoside hydrolase family 61 protein n=1 Tax=Armillaria tabescens TaxID=1929756 RepID=A0AA39NP61_ARMTA|nr:glycoside hydrolase family 61 protein [Desarmillaria tabescens]KAK0469255.1 glycoside hydrolase family 61 protein [Desarmillaria tabescens]